MLRTLQTPRRSIVTMAFAEKHFDSASYSDHRPTYGKALFDQLLSYHTGPRQLAIDIGCGTGQITTVLSKHFEHVRGFDTSATMLSKAKDEDNVMYSIGRAECLPDVGDGSVDLVTVGQAAHWFNHPLWFKEMARILRPQGTLSFWSYNEAVFSDSEAATSIWSHYSHAEDKLGPCWPQPGRAILESAMDGIDPPPDQFTDIVRHYTAQCGSQTLSPVSKQCPLRSVEKYFRTSSAFHNWQNHSENKNKKARTGYGSGDIIDEMMDEIKDRTGWMDNTIINVHWPTISVLARRDS